MESLLKVLKNEFGFGPTGGNNIEPRFGVNLQSDFLPLSIASDDLIEGNKGSFFLIHIAKFNNVGGNAHKCFTDWGESLAMQMPAQCNHPGKIDYTGYGSPNTAAFDKAINYTVNSERD